MIDSIKITSLTNIGANLSYTSIFPVVDMVGTPTTKKANLQIIGNYILSQAGSSNFVQAAQATLAQSVVNAAQPNITSVGTLDIGSLHISGGQNGYVLQTDGTGNVAWSAPGGSGNGETGGANTQVQFNNAGNFGGNSGFTFDKTTGILTVPTEVKVSQLSADNNLTLYSGATGANWRYIYYANGLFETPSNVNFLGSRLNLGYGSQIINLTNPTFVSTLSGGQFIQAALINQSPTGSSDWSAYGANSDETQGWVDMGFTSHGFNDANYTITEPGVGYIFSQGYANGIGGHLVLSTGNLGNTPDIVFSTGGFQAADEFARIDHANNVFHLVRTGSGIQFQDGTIQTTAATGGANTGNLRFTSNAMYNLGGAIVENADLSHGATSALIIPANGNTSTPAQITNTYGNVVISAGINANALSWVFGGDGSLIAPGNADFNGNVVTLGPGASELAAGLNNPTLVISDTGDAFIQAAINNVSDIGSADWVAYGHHGNDAGGWVDLGFTSSFFSDANYTITGPGDGYVFTLAYPSGQAPAVGGGNLVLATGQEGTTKDIVFATGGFLSSNEFARIDHSNNVFHLTRTGSGIQFEDSSVQTTAAVNHANTGFNASAPELTFEELSVFIAPSGSIGFQNLSNSPYQIQFAGTFINSLTGSVTGVGTNYQVLSSEGGVYTIPGIAIANIGDLLTMVLTIPDLGKVFRITVVGGYNTGNPTGAAGYGSITIERLI